MKFIFLKIYYSLSDLNLYSSYGCPEFWFVTVSRFSHIRDSKYWFLFSRVPNVMAKIRLRIHIQQPKQQGVPTVAFVRLFLLTCVIASVGLIDGKGIVQILSLWMLIIINCICLQWISKSMRRMIYSRGYSTLPLITFFIWAF